MAEVLAARDRDAAAPTFRPEGLYFLGPYYDAALALPNTPGARLAALTRCRHWRPLITMTRTRIKICGLTREADVDEAAGSRRRRAGLRAVRQQPRHVSLARAAELAARLPPFVTPVLLFVNASPGEVHAATSACRRPCCSSTATKPRTSACRQRPALPACRPHGAGLRFVRLRGALSGAQALLLDTHVDGYGGSGKVFDWSLIPPSVPLPVVLSGGLNPANVTEGVLSVRPWAVDVSSGVEVSKGVKSGPLMRRFCKAVREADARIAAM
jgi:phosphoribosylanthranilate isomerase